MSKVLICISLFLCFSSAVHAGHDKQKILTQVEHKLQSKGISISHIELESTLNPWVHIGEAIQEVSSDGDQEILKAVFSGNLGDILIDEESQCIVFVTDNIVASLACDIRSFIQ